MEDYRKKYLIFGAEKSLGKSFMQTIAKHCGVLLACVYTPQQEKIAREQLKEYQHVHISCVPSPEWLIEKYVRKLLYLSVTVDGIFYLFRGRSSDYPPQILFNIVCPLLKNGKRFILVPCTSRVRSAARMMIHEICKNPAVKERGIEACTFSHYMPKTTLENLL